MAFTKITAAGIGSTETVTLDGLTVINNVSVGGTLTYEDVTNIDSVGLITARAGVIVGSGITLSKDGDGFFTGVVTATSYAGDGSALTGLASTDVIFPDKISFSDSASGSINIGVSSDLQIYHNGSHSFVQDVGTGSLKLAGADVQIVNADNTAVLAQFISGGKNELRFDNSTKLETTNTGVTVTGTVSDSNGDVRSIPQNNTTGTYTLVAADAAKHVLATGTVTIPNSVFSAGDAVTIINNSGSDITLTASVGTLYNTADASTGNRTLAGRGMATIIFSSATVAYISGAGLS